MLYIHLFGYLRLLVDGEPYRFRGLPKTTFLLAYLLLNRHTAVSREHLAFVLWDDVSEEEARANLRRHLHDLTQRLPKGEDWVLRDMKTVQWNPAAPVWLDIAEFEALCQDTNRLTEAIALYTGDLLQASYEEWINAERERYQVLFLSTLAGLMVRERDRGDLFQAMIYARQLLSQDPLREDVVREYMLMRHASGDRAGAIQLYQQFKERLAEELGVEPMVETAELFEQLSNSQSPVVLSQTMQAQPVPEKASTTPPHNLPARLTSFVGREEELAQVCHLIGSAGSSIRLLTITGPGGTGKTRLALEAGNWLWKNYPEQFPDGVYFIALAALYSPDRILAVINETLAFQVNPNLSDLDNLKNGLQEKKLLLVIDNFEHVLEMAEVLADVLSAEPGLRLLVTSQAPLHLYGEHEYPLAPLPLPDSKDLPLPAELLNFAAVHLFVDRLQAVQPQFRLTGENSRPVVEICRCLDGMPLALELAAARGKLFTPAAMLAQLSRRLRFLTSQARNRSSRHQTLRATIDWSYSLLTTAEQTLFAGTALFAGPFTAEAAQAIFGENSRSHDSTDLVYISAEEVSDLLYSLADRSMLRALPVENVEAPSFRMLQTLREYGLEKLGQIEAADCYFQQYTDYYVNLAELGNAGMQSAEQSVWIQKLKKEANNFIVALDWLLANQDKTQNKVLFARMVKALARFWILQGWVREIVEWSKLALSSLSYLTPSLQVGLLNEYGNAMQVSGDYTNAEATHREALRLARETGEQSLIAHTLHFLAYAAGWQGRYEDAKALFHECLPLYRQLSDVTPIQLTRLLNNLSIVHKRLGEYEASINLLQESLDIKREIDDQLGLPASMANLGNLLILQGKADAAIDLIYEALERRRNILDRQGMLYSINQMAGLAVALGQYGRAATLYAAADAAHQQMALSRATDSEMDKQQNMEIIGRHLSQEVVAESQAVGASLSLEEACEFALQER